ncbi:MAG: hypothetical protein KC635_23135, partial [Myxococcales bacterium]|nr:hypothetical protein [Myxococcales bacterium]
TGELALIDALVTLARSGGTSDATALAAFGRAIARIGADHPELDRHEQIVAWGQALATPGGAPGGGDPAAPSVRQLVDETNRRVDAYFDGLSRVGHGCSSTAACAEQAKRDARAAIERRR